MATLYQSKQSQNQGQALVAGWDNTATLKNITAYVGTDGENFLPVNDRTDGGGYTAGVTRRLTTGGTYKSGLPMVRFVSATLTDGQLKYLVNTIGGGQESFNVTVRYHRYDAVGKADTHVANAVLNLNLEQQNSLNRKQNTWSDFIWEFMLTEILS